MKSIGFILPHVLQFGGVRRALELGNVFTARGYDYTVFANKFDRADLRWFEYWGRINDWSHISADVLIIADAPSFRVLGEVQGGTVYYWVIGGGVYLDPYQKLYSKTEKSRWLVNNRKFLPSFPEAHLVEGGVDTKKFFPNQVKVGYYAGRGRSKGEGLIVEALSDREPTVQLIPIQGVPNDSLPHVYRSLDYFVAWEQAGGWSNMAAEAIACGVPVVTNGVNCQPFLGRCIVVDDLKEFFLDPMAAYSWEVVADKLLKIWGW